MGQQAVNSLATGSVYALLAAGCLLMYNTNRPLYLAYGGLYALGGYLAWWSVRASLTVWTALAVAALSCGLGALVLHWGLGMASRSERSRLLIGLGLLVCLQETYRLTVGGYHLKVVAMDSYQMHQIGPLIVTERHWFIMGGAFVLLTTLQGLLTTSRLGQTFEVLLAGQTADAGQGPLPRRVQAVACGLGAVLAGVTGVLASLYFNDVYPAMGTNMTHKILALVLVGTCRRVQVAVLLGFALALFEEILMPQLPILVPSEVGLLAALVLLGSGHRPQRACETW